MNKEQKKLVIDFAIDVVAIYTLVLGGIYFLFGFTATVVALGGLVLALVLFLVIFKPWIPRD